ncbi:hypothetical protein BDZ45DRAFT_751582 [Acephala macrosclerotiorum]|nr:hypothetical protein BDZ45DRAFT_751582 [Acephala macrosclerotiorum]
MAGSGTDTSIDATKPIRIIGAARGIIRKESRLGIDVAWSLNSLERTIGPQLTALLPQTNVDSSVKEGEDGLLVLNTATCEPRYHVYPTKRFLRAGRQKLRTVLTSGLDIQYGKKLE